MPTLKFLVITATCLVTHLFFVQTAAANPFLNQVNAKARGEIRAELDNFLDDTLTITDDQPSIRLEDGLAGVKCLVGKDSRPGQEKKCQVYYFVGQIDWSKSDDPTYIQGFFYASGDINFEKPSAARYLPSAAVFTLTALMGKFTPVPMPATYLSPGDTVSTGDAFPSRPDASVYLKYAFPSLIFETSRPLPILELAFFSSGHFSDRDFESSIFSRVSDEEKARRVWQEFVDTSHLTPFLHGGPGRSYLNWPPHLQSKVDAKEIFGVGILCKSPYYVRLGCLQFYSRTPSLGRGDDAEPVVLYDIHTRKPFLNSDKLTPYFQASYPKSRGSIASKSVFMPFGVVSLSALERAGIELPDDALIWDPQVDTPQTFFPPRYSGYYWPVESLYHLNMLQPLSTPNTRKLRLLPEPSE